MAYFWIKSRCKLISHRSIFDSESKRHWEGLSTYRQQGEKSNLGLITVLTFSFQEHQPHYKNIQSSRQVYTENFSWSPTQVINHLYWKIENLHVELIKKLASSESSIWVGIILFFVSNSSPATYIYLSINWILKYWSNLYLMLVHNFGCFREFYVFIFIDLNF